MSSADKIAEVLKGVNLASQSEMHYRTAADKQYVEIAQEIKRQSADSSLWNNGVLALTIRVNDRYFDVNDPAFKSILANLPGCSLTDVQYDFFRMVCRPKK
jgi:hypothetical protein